MSDDALQCAVNVANPNNYVELDNNTICETRTDPEIIAIQKDLYQKLSPDAKKILKLIYYPSEKDIILLQSFKLRGSTVCLRTRRETALFHPQRLLQYFRLKWGGRKRARQAVNEVAEFAQNLLV